MATLVWAATSNALGDNAAARAAEEQGRNCRVPGETGRGSRSREAPEEAARLFGVAQVLRVN